jgi:hypothetical protein
VTDLLFAAAVKYLEISKAPINELEFDTECGVGEIQLS